MVEVDICERDVGFVLSVGPVSLWLGPGVAIDVLDTLARAIALEERQNGDGAAPDRPVAARRRACS